jgi:hypothetical protein
MRKRNEVLSGTKISSREEDIEKVPGRTAA